MTNDSTCYFGIAGWSYPDWKGIVYPPNAPSRFDELSYISQYFDAIELNNTFYRIPESKMVESWVRRVAHNPRFRFTAKLWQGFTHGKEAFSKKEVNQYLLAMDPLKERLGAVLIQFPTSFKNDEASRQKLVDLVNYFGCFDLVVEFRHRSWNQKETFDLLSDSGVGYCNVDEPMFRHLLKPAAIVTGDTAYVRFHGRNYQNWYSETANRDSRYDYLYSDEELDQWIPRINEMGNKAKKVYIIGNNHFRGQAPANILQLKSKIAKGPVDVPESMFDAFPQLDSIAKKRRKKTGQGNLFE